MGSLCVGPRGRRRGRQHFRQPHHVRHRRQRDARAQQSRFRCVGTRQARLFVRPLPALWHGRRRVRQCQRSYTFNGAPMGSAEGIRVGWTAGGGLDYALTPNWSLGAEYRYTDLGNRHAGATGFVDSNSFNYNVVRAVLTYRFAPPPPPPPAPAPMPAAAPAPMPAPPQTFLVFFDFDRYNLNEDARRVVEAAAGNYKSTGSARIEVSGYTDLAGTQAYNMRLSQRRADAVTAYLMRQGVPKNVMDVKWFGKQNPRVPTADGVREPQNRRVEIVMMK